MNIPTLCATWEKAMDSDSNATRKILQNFKNDKCLKSAITTSFFDELAQKAPFDSPKDAQDKAWEIINLTPDKYLCNGKTVRINFVTLFRIEDIHYLRWRMPSQIIDEKGLRDAELHTLPDDELLSLTNEYDGPIKLGNPNVVWIADADEITNLHEPLDKIANRLGINVLRNTSRCIICVYNKNEAKDATGMVRSLHVPRSFDGACNPEFELVQDCSADCGRTKPITLSSNDSLSEAVHRECTVINRRWELKYGNDHI